MRQAIKGDGSDGTEALKAYLLTHDNVLAQELYEFITPGITGALGAGTGSTSAFSEALVSSVVLDGTDPWGQLGYLANEATIERWTSRPWYEYNNPGAVIFTLDTGIYGAPGSDSGSARPRADIVKVFALADCEVTSGVWIDSWKSAPTFAYSPTLQVSVDGGTSWSSMPVPPADQGTLSDVVDITPLITALPGGIASFDFGQIRFQFLTRSSLFVDLDPASPSVAAVSGVGIRFDYGSPGGPPPGVVDPIPLVKVCDASSALTYAGDVYVPANIKNSGFKSKIGLDVDSLQLEWRFRGDEPMVTDPASGATILTMLQGFKEGLWAGVWVKWRRVYMPTFGDCDSLGAVKMFRGRIADVQVDRLNASIRVNSVTEMFNRQIPQQLIESNNRSLQVGPGLPPDLDPNPLHWTYFECLAGEGGTVQKIVARQTAPTADQVYAPGTYDLGYLMFQASPLKNFVAQVQRYDVVDGFNVFYLFRPLYVDPHSYDLIFAAFVPVPKDQTISGAGGVDLNGFKFVPLPEQAV